VSYVQLGLGMPMGAEWICILAFMGIIVAVVVVAVLARVRRPAPHVFPIGPPSGPGKFKVSGVNRDSRQDVVWYCDADSPANAQVKAELEGIIVTAIERQAE
jgi:hypothetical protein